MFVLSIFVTIVKLDPDEFVSTRTPVDLSQENSVCEVFANNMVRLAPAYVLSLTSLIVMFPSFDSKDSPTSRFTGIMKPSMMLPVSRFTVSFFVCNTSSEYFNLIVKLTFFPSTFTMSILVQVTSCPSGSSPVEVTRYSIQCPSFTPTSAAKATVENSNPTRTAKQIMFNASFLVIRHHNQIFFSVFMGYGIMGKN